MTSKENQPATPLPWHVGLRQAEQIVYDVKGWAVANATVYHGESDLAETKANARYIAHAANAYPRLVEALRGIIQSYDANNGDSLANAVNAACDTLAELGEAE